MFRLISGLFLIAYFLSPAISMAGLVISTSTAGSNQTIRVCDTKERYEGDVFVNATGCQSKEVSITSNGLYKTADGIYYRQECDDAVVSPGGGLSITPVACNYVIDTGLNQDVSNTKAEPSQGLVPCGGTGQAPCQTCDVVQLANNVISWLITILGTIGALIIVYAGVKLVTSSGNTHAAEEAKGMISNIIIGYIIILSAWLVIDYGMKALVVQDPDAAFGVWNKLACTTQIIPSYTDQITINFIPINQGLQNLQGWVPAGGTGDYGTVSGGEPGSYNAACSVRPGPPGVRDYDCSLQETQCKSAGGIPSINSSGSSVICKPTKVVSSGSGGSCSVVTNSSNACYPSKLTCFSDQNLASKICNLESSGGNTRILSGTDLCQDGSSFSVGLWQINILANRALIPGCTGSFFTSSNGGQSEGTCSVPKTNSVGVQYCQFRSCRITNRNIYNTCVMQAQNPVNNTNAACSLFRTQGWGAWQTSYNRCR